MVEGVFQDDAFPRLGEDQLTVLDAAGRRRRLEDGDILYTRARGVAPGHAGGGTVGIRPSGTCGSLRASFVAASRRGHDCDLRRRR